MVDLFSSDTVTAGELKEGCDFNFRLGHETETLDILLLTPSSIESSVTQEATSRLRQLSAHASGISKKAVAFLLSETAFHSASGRYRLDGLVTLQALMIESLPDMLPIIPVADADSLLASVQEYIANLETRDNPQQQRQQHSANTMGFAESRFFSTSASYEQGRQSFSKFAGL
ncbi:hypothetical protein AnigIFM63309_009033 [Aspergillus niger]|nr:hypothetical protein AnigIFM50267_009120 [Aspergillus niger]GLA34854.1 hypothetical protein AnigIFM63309_009033 [Aspergillus niger]